MLEIYRKADDQKSQLIARDIAIALEKFLEKYLLHSPHRTVI